MLFFCCSREFVRAFSRLFSSFIYKATGFSLPRAPAEREPDIECEIREKRLARRIFGRAIVFVFFCDKLLWILLAWRVIEQLLVDSFCGSFLDCVVK